MNPDLNWEMKSSESMWDSNTFPLFLSLSLSFSLNMYFTGIYSLVEYRAVTTYHKLFSGSADYQSDTELLE